MRIILISLFASILLLAATPTTKPTATIYKTVKSTLAFSSEAPMEIIKAESSKMVGLINTEKKSFAFQVSVITFEGFNSDLQREHFNENYMESTKYPKIKFVGKILGDVNFSSPFNKEVEIEGKINVHGVEKPRKFKAQLVNTGSKITINAKFDIVLADHKINIPTIVNQKLAKLIHVNVEAEMLPK